MQTAANLSGYATWKREASWFNRQVGNQVHRWLAGPLHGSLRELPVGSRFRSGGPAGGSRQEPRSASSRLSFAEKVHNVPVRGGAPSGAPGNRFPPAPARDWYAFTSSNETALRLPGRMRAGSCSPTPLVGRRGPWTQPIGRGPDSLPGRAPRHMRRSLQRGGPEWRRDSGRARGCASGGHGERGGLRGSRVPLRRASPGRCPPDLALA